MLFVSAVLFPRTAFATGNYFQIIDIYVLADGTFVETPSGQAAHELKKRYDRIMGVSKDKRSPFAITAFTNQHGRQMYRVGYV